MRNSLSSIERIRVRGLAGDLSIEYTIKLFHEHKVLIWEKLIARAKCEGRVPFAVLAMGGEKMNI